MICSVVLGCSHEWCNFEIICLLLNKKKGFVTRKIRIDTERSASIQYVIQCNSIIISLDAQFRLILYWGDWLPLEDWSFLLSLSLSLFFFSSSSLSRRRSWVSKKSIGEMRVCHVSRRYLSMNASRNLFLFFFFCFLKIYKVLVEFNIFNV